MAVSRSVDSYWREFQKMFDNSGLVMVLRLLFQKMMLAHVFLLTAW